MLAKLYEGLSDSNTFSWHWCVLFTNHTNKMLTSKTQNIFVYPMWGPVLPNSGVSWALDLGGDPVLDNMAPPWVPKWMFIKCTQTTLCNSMPLGAAWAYYIKVLILASTAL